MPIINNTVPDYYHPVFMFMVSQAQCSKHFDNVILIKKKLPYACGEAEQIKADNMKNPEFVAKWSDLGSSTDAHDNLTTFISPKQLLSLTCYENKKFIVFTLSPFLQ